MRIFVMLAAVGFAVLTTAGDLAAQLGSSKTVNVRVDSREELIRAVRDARPGTEILVETGTYRGGLIFENVRGTKGRPIVIAAANEDRPPVLDGGNSVLQFVDPAHLELRNLVLTGGVRNGLNIDDGGSHDSPAHHVTLRGLRISKIGPRGNCDGIKLSGVDDFAVEDCRLNGWGDGGSAIDMVGCHQGTVTSCEFRYRSDLAANGVQTKGGSSDIVIRRCRFEQAGSRAVNIGGSTGRAYFRPQGASYEAKDITVEDCTFIGSMSPIAFVGVGGAIVRHNTIYRPSRWGIRILQESRDADFVPCRNGRFSNNIVAFRSDELRTMVNVGSGTSPGTFTFEKNHWFCIDNPSRSNGVALPAREVDGRSGDPGFVAAERGDLRLRPSSRVREAGVRNTK